MYKHLAIGLPCLTTFQFRGQVHCNLENVQKNTTSCQLLRNAQDPLGMSQKSLSEASIVYQVDSYRPFIGTHTQNYQRVQYL